MDENCPPEVLGDPTGTLIPFEIIFVLIKPQEAQKIYDLHALSFKHEPNKAIEGSRKCGTDGRKTSRNSKHLNCLLRGNWRSEANVCTSGELQVSQLTDCRSIFDSYISIILERPAPRTEMRNEY